ncbi:unnamed protein product [Lathyrus oleraceus]
MYLGLYLIDTFGGT